ncbi:MAG: aminopeptidase P family protein [Burkholderiales bacterium]|nr:aminopeptidase P family protein [Anaerolineae bacterium]
MPVNNNLTETYRKRRQKLVEQTGGGVILIDSSGVSPDKLLFDKNLYYLTGVSDKSAKLLIVPDGIAVESLETLSGPEMGMGRRMREILFVNERSEIEVFMDGPSAACEALKQSTGVDRVYPLSKLNQHVQTALMGTDTLWLNTPTAPELGKPLTPDLQLTNQIRERYYWVTLKNIALIIHQLRWIKDEYEIASLRQAFQIHTEVFEKVMRALKPGENERLGKAIYDYELQMCGDEVDNAMANDLYDSSLIVGSGKNSAIPHYMANNQTIQDGDLVLIDGGVSVNGYSSDITRTFPANGKFTPRQRELYAIVLEAENAAIATMKPGSTILEANQAAYDVFERYGVAQYGYGNNMHPVGLNIHDTHARIPNDREQPFEPGVVLVIEPFLMLPDEGIGIRIEDGVLITENGLEILAGPAREIDAVESLCKRG